MDEALRRFALHFKTDCNISLMASDLGSVYASAVHGVQDVVKKKKRRRADGRRWATHAS